MKIVQLEPLGVSSIEIEKINTTFQKLGHTFVCFDNRTEDENQLIERSVNADILIISNIPLSKNFIDAIPSLKLIAIAFTGFDHIPVDYCKSKGIAVCNAAGYATTSVAELTIGMIISLYRSIVWSDKQTRSLKGREGMLGFELAGKTIGVIGTGSIGLKVIELAKAFRCNILTYSRTIKSIPNVANVSLEELLCKSDVVTLHVPLTESTNHLIGKKELSLMKNTATLINTARGKVVDNNALLEALKEKKIAGAAIDIYETEPPLKSDYPLLNAPNLLMLPHIAYATNEAMKTRFDIVYNNIFSWINGTPKNIINNK